MELCCPICRGTDRYHIDTGRPCGNCWDEWVQALCDGDIPEGTSIYAWGAARETGREALKKGKSLEPAQELVQKKLATVKASEIWVAQMAAGACGRKHPYDSADRDLFK